MAGKYFKPELSFHHSHRILLLPGPKLTCLTLRAILKLFVAFPRVVKGLWGTYLYSHIPAPCRECPGELLTYVSDGFQSTVTST